MIANCRFCSWVRDRICVDCEQDRVEFWAWSAEWERAHSNDYELWMADPDQERAMQAADLQDTDPSAAFKLYLELAEAGSVWSMHRIGQYYEQGLGVVADINHSAEWYCRAITSGSCMATIDYSRLLALQGHFDQCDEILSEGVRADFIPAFFWLGWYRLEQSRSRETYQEVRRLWERGASEGHPAAQLKLGELMSTGKFKIRHIPAGIRLFVRTIARFVDAKEEMKEGALNAPR